MMSVYQMIVAALANVVFIAALYKLVHIFFTTECSRKQEFMVYTIVYVISTGVYVGWNTPEITIVSNILVIFGLTCFYPASWIRRLTATAFVYSILFLCEMVVVEVLNAVGFSRYDAYGDGEFVLVQIADQLLIYSTAIWLSKRKNLSVGQAMPANYSGAIFAVPVCSIYPTYVLMKVTEQPVWQVAVSVLMLFFINALIFYLYDWILGMHCEQLTLAAIAEQSKMYKRQLESEQEAGDKLRRLRHDWNNALLPILGQLEAGQQQDAQTALRGLLETINETKPIVSGIDPAVAAVLNHKLSSAQDKGITVQCHALLPKNLHQYMDSQELGILLGNLLDNAIRAADAYRQDAPYITVDMTVNMGTLHIIITNSFDGHVICKNGRYLSTKADRADHGLGLQTVRYIADKYHGDLEITHQEHDFTVDLLLYLPLAETK